MKEGHGERWSNKAILVPHHNTTRNAKYTANIRLLTDAMGRLSSNIHSKTQVEDKTPATRISDLLILCGLKR